MAPWGEGADGGGRGLVPHAPRPQARLPVEGPESCLSGCQLGTHPPRAPLSSSPPRSSLTLFPPRAGLHLSPLAIPWTPSSEFPRTQPLASASLLRLDWELRHAPSRIWTPGTGYTKRSELLRSTHYLSGIVRHQTSFHPHKSPPREVLLLLPGNRPRLAKGRPCRTAERV